MPHPHSPGEGTGFPGTGISQGFKLPYGCWEFILCLPASASPLAGIAGIRHLAQLSFYFIIIIYLFIYLFLTFQDRVSLV